MISEVVFSKKFTSFWNGIFPHTSKFIRLVNSGLDRIDEPMPPIEDDRKNIISIVNEAGFRLFNNLNSLKDIRHVSVLNKYLKDNSGLLDSIINDSESYIKNIDKGKIWENFSISGQDKSDILEISIRLMQRFYPEHITINPVFHGCGFINECKGDILVINKNESSLKLVEIKSGDRNFNISDFRQLLIYAGLNYANRDGLQIKNFELYNPRRGVSYQSSIKELCWDLGYITPEEFFEEFIFYITETITLSLDLNNSLDVYK